MSKTSLKKQRLFQQALKGAAHLFAAFLPILLLTLWACDPDSGGKPPATPPERQACDPDPNATTPFVASEVPRGTNDYRLTFGAFSVATGTLPKGDYLLAVRKASPTQPVPSSADFDIAEKNLTALSRYLCSDSINVYMPLLMNTDPTVITPVYITAPTTGSSKDPDLSRIMLGADDDYTLYAEAGGTVEKLLDFSTDSLSDLGTKRPTQFNLPPSTVKFTIKKGEKIITALYSDSSLLNGGSLGIDIVTDNNLTLLSSYGAFVAASSGYNFYYQTSFNPAGGTQTVTPFSFSIPTDWEQRTFRYRDKFAPANSVTFTIVQQ